MSSVITQAIPTITEFINSGLMRGFNSMDDLKSWVFNGGLNKSMGVSDQMVCAYPEMSTIIFPTLINKIHGFGSNFTFIINADEYKYATPDAIYPLAYFDNINGDHIVVAIELDRLGVMDLQLVCINLCKRSFNINKGSAQKLLSIYNYPNDLKNLFAHLMGIKFNHDITLRYNPYKLEAFVVIGINGGIKFNGIKLESNTSNDVWEAHLSDGTTAIIQLNLITQHCKILN